MRKITVITGASSGLGAEFARQISKKLDSDEEIWLIARNQDKLLKVKDEIIKTCPILKEQCIKLFPLDISGSKGIQDFEVLLKNENQCGNFTIKTLINNAGFGTYGPFDETPLEKELSMIELNCLSLTGICGKSLPYLTKGSGIINVASLAAFLPLGNFAVYAATKAYVLNFSVALCAELKDKGIKVSALCPGSVSTDFANVASNGARKEVLHGKDPVKVVRHCLKSFKKGKKIVLWSSKWKFTAFMSRFIGRYLGARFTYLYNKRPYKHL